MKVYLAFLQRMKDTKVPKLVSIGDKLLGATCLFFVLINE